MKRIGVVVFPGVQDAPDALNRSSGLLRMRIIYTSYAKLHCMPARHCATHLETYHELGNSC